MTGKYLAAAAVALTMSFTGTVQASVTTYTNEADWIAAVGLFDNEPFDAGGLQAFTGVTTTHGVIGTARVNLTGSVWRDEMDGVSDSTTFSYLPGPLTAAGGTWDTAPSGDGAGLTLTLNLDGGGTEPVAQIGPIDGDFFGFVSSDSFASFSITIGPGSDAETFDLDNLHLAVVPEPASMAVLGLGLVALGGMHRRRRVG